MAASERRIEVADLRFAVRSAPARAGQLESFLSTERRWETPPDEVVRLEEGPHALFGDAGEVVVRSPAEETIVASLRGMLVFALDRRGSALVHGAGAVVDGQAILCVAPSGGGKTTLCGKVAGRLPVLSDETLAIWLDAERPSLAGTFLWSGESLPTLPGRFPLAAICLLAKGDAGVAPVARAEALRALLAEWHLPPHADAGKEALRRAARLVAQVPVFRLSTRLDTDPVPWLRRALQLGP